MGLDMYFLNTEENNINEIEDIEDYEFYYFRKHPDLHGWLRDKWLEEHPESTSDDFNGVYMEITEDILNELEKYAFQPEHKKYSGFFWGESSDEKWKQTQDELIPKICEKIELGEKVYYYPSW